MLDSFALAVVLTLIAGIVLVVLYRRAVRGHMETRALAPRPAAQPSEPATSREAEDATATTPADSGAAAAIPTRDVSSALRAGRAAYARAAIVYTVAGLVHATIGTVLYHLIGGLGF